MHHHSISVFVTVFRHRSGPCGPRTWRRRGGCILCASINRATTTSVGPESSGAAVLSVEILLDRAHFSCGEIDARYGQNLKNAIEAYQLANQLTVDGVLGPSV
jgi:hypothetical protein